MSGLDCSICQIISATSLNLDGIFRIAGPGSNDRSSKKGLRTMPGLTRLTWMPSAATILAQGLTKTTQPDIWRHSTRAPFLPGRSAASEPMKITFAPYPCVCKAKVPGCDRLTIALLRLIAHRGPRFARSKIVRSNRNDPGRRHGYKQSNGVTVLISSLAICSPRADRGLARSSATGR